MIGRLASRLLLGLLLSISYVIGLSRQESVPWPELTVYEEVMPDHRLPRDAVCDWRYYAAQQSPCHVIRGTTRIGLDYAVQAQRIVTTYYAPANSQTIGAWIVGKGRPAGFRRQGRAWYITWGDGMTAFVYTKRFRPDSPVLLLIFGDDTTSNLAWSGFVNAAVPP